MLQELERELVKIPIRAEGLSVTKSLVWRADNDNPMVPLFLEMVKQQVRCVSGDGSL